MHNLESLSTEMDLQFSHSACSIAQLIAEASAIAGGLAQAIVTDNAFLGEVVSTSPIGEPGLLYNNCGVEFVEAFAKADLKDLDLYNQDNTIKDKLVVEKKQDVLDITI